MLSAGGTVFTVSVSELASSSSPPRCLFPKSFRSDLSRSGSDIESSGFGSIRPRSDSIDSVRASPIIHVGSSPRLDTRCEPRRCNISNRLDEVISCDHEEGLKILVIAATYPFHVEWTNAEWSRACGWSSEEIQGLDLDFLRGDATDKREVNRFMTRLMASGGNADLKSVHYNKDNVIMQHTIHCSPLMDDCGPKNSQKISHIAMVLADSYQVPHGSDSIDDMEGERLDEVGMPIDRRESCEVYEKRGTLPAPSIEEWLRLTDKLPLALAMRYMLRSQAPILLLDQEGCIVHANVAWTHLVGCALSACECIPIEAFFGDSTDEGAREHFLRLTGREDSMSSAAAAVIDKDNNSSGSGMSSGGFRSYFPSVFPGQAAASAPDVPDNDDPDAMDCDNDTDPANTTHRDKSQPRRGSKRKDHKDRPHQHQHHHQQHHEHHHHSDLTMLFGDVFEDEKDEQKHQHQQKEAAAAPRSPTVRVAFLSMAAATDTQQAYRSLKTSLPPSITDSPAVSRSLSRSLSRKSILGLDDGVFPIVRSASSRAASWGQDERYSFFIPGSSPPPQAPSTSPRSPGTCSSSPRSVNRRPSWPTIEIPVTLCPTIIGASGKHVAVMFVTSL